MITVAVPVLGRPKRIPKVARRFNDPRVELLFLPDPTDGPTLDQLERHKLPYAFAPAAKRWRVPTYASKINHAFRLTSTPFLAYVGDDVKPRGDWVTAALERLADERVGVLATNDLLNRNVQAGFLATHGIVRRAYVEEFGSASTDDGPVMSEVYRHWCCDAELSAVARLRGRFQFAPDVVLKHAKGKPDATTAIARAYRRRDRATLKARFPTWPRLEGR